MNPITLCATCLPDTPPLEFIAAAAGAGYDGIGLRLHKSPTFPNWVDWLHDEPLKREVKRAIVSSGQPMTEMLSYRITPDLDLDEMAPSLEFGALLGATYALTIGNDEDWNRQVDNFGRFCEYIAQFDLIASIEAPAGQITPMANVFRIIEESGAVNAAIAVDPTLLIRAGDTPEILKGKNRNLLPYTQLNDGMPPYTQEVDGQIGTDRMRPGLGTSMLPELLDALVVDVPLSLEWPQPRGSHYTPLEWATYALNGTREFLDEYYQQGLRGRTPAGAQ
jgi:sugar phosphate isomerase/epimerase